MILAALGIVSYRTVGQLAEMSGLSYLLRHVDDLLQRLSGRRGITQNATASTQQSSATAVSDRNPVVDCATRRERNGVQHSQSGRARRVAGETNLWRIAAAGQLSC